MQMKCDMCGMKHEQSLSNCCWIDCECGHRICGRCGSTEIYPIIKSELDLSDYADDNYWCCEECLNCGLRVLECVFNNGG